MANGIGSKPKTVSEILTSLLDRVRRLERPTSIRIGGIGGAIGGVGYTISINDIGQMIATSDNGTITVIALP